MKKPRLNTYVYVLTYAGGEPFCISKDKVYMKNKEAFICEDTLSDNVIDEYKHELYYEDYNCTWFYKMKDIRFLLKIGNYKIVKCSNNQWNIEEENK